MKREEQVRLTKQKLLTAADQLIVKEGYAAVSVERITKLAGVSKGTFYTYFKKKGDLMIALTQRRFAAINDQIPLLVNGDPVEGIRYYLMSYLKVVTNQSTLAMVRSWLRFILDPSNGQIGKFENDRRGIERLLQGLVDHQRLTASTPVATIANLLTVELYGILVAWGVDDQASPGQRLRDYCDVALGSMLAPYLVK